MTLKTYLIVYTVYDNDNIVIHTGKLKAKNKMSEFDAKVKTEDHLKKKYPNFHRLVIHQCRQDSIFGDIFSGFGF